MCSNVEGHTEPVCLVDADQDQLAQSMVTHMYAIAYRVNELAEEKWGWLFKAIDAKIDETEELDEEWIRRTVAETK